MKINITALEKSKKEGKDQESIQSSTIPDPPFENNIYVLLKQKYNFVFENLKFMLFVSFLF